MGKLGVRPNPKRRQTVNTKTVERMFNTYFYVFVVSFKVLGYNVVKRRSKSD